MSKWDEVGPELLEAAIMVLSNCRVAAPGPYFQWDREYYDAFNALEEATVKAEGIKK